MVEKMDEKTVLRKVGWLEFAKVSLWDDKLDIKMELQAEILWDILMVAKSEIYATESWDESKVEATAALKAFKMVVKMDELPVALTIASKVFELVVWKVQSSAA